MKKGAILEAAHRDTQAGLVGGVILVLLCLGVLGLNWKYVYNVVAGAAPFTAASTGSRWDFDLFVTGAAVLLPLGVLIAAASWRRRMNVERYGPIAGLKRYGNPSFVIAAIEKEFATLGSSARVTPLWIGVSWAVGLEPSLHILKVSDIVGAAHVTTPSTGSKPGTHGVRFWVAGEMAPTTIDMSEQEARAVLAALDTKSAGIVKDDAAVFDKRWKQDRDACEQEAKKRRSLKRTA
jgi:hypothetical protein